MFRSKKMKIPEKFFFPFFGSRGLPARARRGPILQGLRWKFKNRYGDPNSMPLKYSQRKNQPNRPSGLGCRGGCHRFGVLLILYLGFVCIHFLIHLFLHFLSHSSVLPSDPFPCERWPSSMTTRQFLLAFTETRFSSLSFFSSFHLLHLLLLVSR